MERPTDQPDRQAWTAYQRFHERLRTGWKPWHFVAVPAWFLLLIALFYWFEQMTAPLSAP